MTIGIANDAKPEMDDKGTTVAVEWITRTHDRAAGTSSESTETQSPDPKCIPENFAAERIDGTAVRYGDMMAFFLAQDLDNEPKPGNLRVQLGGTWYSVMEPLERWFDGDEVAAYRLHLRSG